MSPYAEQGQGRLSKISDRQTLSLMKRPAVVQHGSLNGSLAGQG